jgi:aerobic-type carbon monoxide dehydrogenase small subunit (CoxS/CutS family)
MASTHTLSVNGREVRAPAIDAPLLFFLRDTLGLTGAKISCGEGACGACTVLLDGAPVRACVTPLSAADGRHIETIEALAEGDALHPLQQAFIDADAFQCGYCTPGMIMAALGLLRQNPAPTEAQIVAHLEGNICRCGMYARIVEAVQRAAAAMAAANEAEDAP